MPFGNLTPASLGFGSRTGQAGVVTIGFGTSGTPPPPVTKPTSAFQPPPTYAIPVLFDEKARDVKELIRSAKFNPIWIKWFIDLTGKLASTGAGSGTVTAITVAGTGVTVTGSPITSAGTIRLTVTPATIGAPSGSGTSTGTNTGDQTTIVGITGTIAQFNTACTNAVFATGGGTATGTNTGDQDLSGLVPYSGATGNVNLGAHGLTTTGLSSTTVKCTNAAGFISSDNSAGITTTVTTASLVGKTMTFKDGLLVGFA
jgi:hypothetical protein